jgi:hypothetical protein
METQKRKSIPPLGCLVSKRVFKAKYRIKTIDIQELSGYS